MGVFLKPFVRRMILRLVYCLIVLIHEIRANNVTETQSQRGKRQFSLFTIVSFPNDQCSAKSASTTGVTYGTCLSSTECNSQSGTVDGNCASGFGVCCTFSVSSCGSSVSKNCTYVQNPSYSSSYTVTTTTSCSFTVKPLNTDICQIKFDFDTFSTTTGTTGTCTDTFTITDPSKSSNTTPNLCGTMSGQHLYVENARSTSSLTMQFTIATTTGVTWSIKVIQIECSNPLRAPSGCDNSLTGASGIIKNLSFATGRPSHSHHFGYCVRREQGFCAIQYAPNSGITNNFLLNAIQIEELESLAAASVGFITVANAVGAYSHGSKFFTTQTQKGIAATASTAVFARPPFSIHYETNKVDDTSPTYGFNLQYNQIPCGTPIDTQEVNVD